MQSALPDSRLTPGQCRPSPDGSPARPRILIADDHAIVREGLRRSLESFDLDVVEAVADGRAAVAGVERRRPDAVIMDISMPGMDGIAASEIIRSRHPGIPIVVLTFHADDGVHRHALEAGASLVLTKDVPTEDVVSVLRELMAGEEHGERRPGTGGPAGSCRYRTELTLTGREVEILALITRGASTTRIASELYISVKTVKNHLASIYEKLDVTDRTQAVLAALRLGLVSLDA